MRHPPPSYPPPPPPPSAMAIPAGYTITLCGPAPIVKQQQRLLPLSRNILCLPPLEWHTPQPVKSPPQSRRSSHLNPARLSRSSSHRQSSYEPDVEEVPTEPTKPTMEQLKTSALKLHNHYLKRYETAREFLEAPRNVADAERRIVVFSGGERDVKAICIEGLKEALKDEAEVEKVWRELVANGVEGLLENGNTSGESLARSSTMSGGSEGHQSTPKPLSLNSNVPMSNSSLSPVSPTDARTPTAYNSTTEVFKPTAVRHPSQGRSRGSQIARRSSPPPSVAETDEEHRRSPSPERSVTTDGMPCESESEEPPPRTRRLDSAYSSGVDTIPTPPASAEIRDPEFRYQSRLSEDGRSRSMSPGAVPLPEPPRSAPSPRYTQSSLGSVEENGYREQKPVEPLFPCLGEDLIITFVPELPQDDEQFVERLLGNETTRRSTVQSRPPSSAMNRGLHKHPLFSGSFRMSSPPTLEPQKVYLLDKTILEIQNEVRAVLTKKIPPPNTADSPAQVEFPEASKWLLEPETDLFGPLMSGGVEGLPEALCPSLDMIVAVGADGRDQKEANLVDDTERQSATLARILADDIEKLGSRGFADARGSRTSLKFTLRSFLPYLAQHPGATIEDVAAGDFMIPLVELYQKSAQNVRVLVLDFDLKSGSQAILSLKSLLPPELFKLIVVGEAGSSAHGHGNRIYVRTSVGKTTTSFSALPSPLHKEKPKIRRLESAKMSVRARADVVIPPWTVRGVGEYHTAMTTVREGIRQRRITCGVLDEAPRAGLDISTTHAQTPSPFPPPSTPPPPVPSKVKPQPRRVIEPAPPGKVAKVVRIPSPNQRQSIERATSPEKSIPERRATPGRTTPLERRTPPLNGSPAVSPSSSPIPMSSDGQPRQKSRRRSSSARASSQLRKEVVLQITGPDSPPHPGTMVQIGRRDSDCNSHGGGISISSGSTHHPKPPNSAPLTSVNWNDGTYFDAQADDDDDIEEVGLPSARRGSARNGSKALRLLGIET